MAHRPGHVAVIVLLAALSFETSCSRTSLSRSLAADLILRHEQRRYDEDCDVSFLADAKGSDWGASVSDLRAKVGGRLGRSICAYSVEVSGISLTSESTRDAVFTETKSYDVAKLRALSAYVDALFARLSRVPVQAVSDVFHALVVIDPSNGQKFALEHVPLWSSEETAKELARARVVTIDDIWGNIPSGLARHRRGSVKVQRVARLQLFDDGWRVLDVSPPSSPSE